MTRAYDRGLDVLGADPVPVCVQMPRWEITAIFLGALASMTTLWSVWRRR